MALFSRRTHGDVLILDGVLEDLRGMDSSLVALEILDLAGCELEYPDAPSSIQGRLERQPHMMWRRAVRFQDQSDYERLDDLGPEDDWGDRPQAYDWVLVYRPLTADEQINMKRRKNGLIIVAIVNNSKFDPANFESTLSSSPRR